MVLSLAQFSFVEYNDYWWGVFDVEHTVDCLIVFEGQQQWRVIFTEVHPSTFPLAWDGTERLHLNLGDIQGSEVYIASTVYSVGRHPLILHRWTEYGVSVFSSRLFTFSNNLANSELSLPSQMICDRLVELFEICDVTPQRGLALDLSAGEPGLSIRVFLTPGNIKHESNTAHCTSSPSMSASNPFAESDFM